MSDLPHISQRDIVLKYLDKNNPLFNDKVMQYGRFGFYEPDAGHCNKIPYSSSQHYGFMEDAAPINFVILSAGINNVGDNAFEDRADLLVFDAKFSDELILGKQSFQGCKNLYKICLPYEIKSIDKTAFYGCHGLSVVETTRGKLDNDQEIPRDKRGIYNPVKYSVVIIRGHPYIYDPKQSDNHDVFEARKLVVKDGKFSDPVIFARQFISFDKIKGYPHFYLYGLGHTSDMAKINLNKEIENVRHAVSLLSNSKSISQEQVGAAIASFKQK